MAKKRARKAALAVFELAVAMEEPLNDTIALVRALRLAGDAMVAKANPECGEPVIAVAEAAARRLRDLEGVWTELFGAAATVKAAV
jgi:hypothetical protein